MRADLTTSAGVKCPSYVDSILFQAKWDAHRPAIGTEAGVLTYGQLAEAILAAAARCAQAGLQAGTVVGLVVKDPVWHVCLICALHRLGVISASIEAAEGGLPLGFAAILYDKVRPAGFIGAAIQVDPGWFAAQPTQTAAPAVPFGARDVCRVALSSGTTGEPKPIAMSPEILWDRFTTYTMRGGFAAAQRIFCGPTLRSHFAFAVAFTALSYGKMVAFADNAATATPVMSFYGIDLAVLSVQQLGDITDMQERSFGGLGSLREIQAGGSTISEALLNRVRAFLPVPILNTYASTEAGTAALGAVEKLGLLRGEGSVGFLVPWAEVEACDDAGRVLPRGQDGNLRVRALGMAAPFRSGLKTVEPMAAFMPGDYGRVLDNGMLVVSGRTNDVINIGGTKLAAEWLDRQVMRCKGVRDAAVLAVPGPSGLPQIVVAIVADGSVDEADVARRCAELSSLAKPSAIHRVSAIPRNSTGKIMREQLRREVLATPSAGPPSGVMH
ncbi:class I adenylate-forming enzyme family protein [Rhodoplanes roseus]|nr:fatty acid--CoA ligase family protein [Rhodoplanes roseus]